MIASAEQSNVVAQHDIAVMEPFGFDFEALAADMRQEMDQGIVTNLATELLGSVFRFADDDGEVRTFEQIDAETEAIWSNPLVRQIDGLAAKIAQRHAEFCAGHGRESQLGAQNDPDHLEHTEDKSSHRFHEDIDDEDDEDDVPHGKSRTRRPRKHSARRHRHSRHATKKHGSWILSYATTNHK
jgi:hypothetical protein